ncbi:hypothetical protein ONE63_009300 [Megalurothrips usitatus]|uniref:Ig-like domain-containing protein n=1 Tax=Megalurothrips usitatus TaxID=439358 RepID=A0AAV7XJ60_9NEOP|nr:hypothetical protein ONE63_009300 [Megalurothrips usitatus]
MSHTKYLDDLSIDALRTVRNLLQPGAWRDVAKAFGMDEDSCVREGTYIVDALIERNVTVDALKVVLNSLELYEALSYISEPEETCILSQPFSVSDDCIWEQNQLLIKEGGKLHLKIVVKGSPMPKFQWFHENNCIRGDTDLIISDFRVHNEGTYRCSLTQHRNSGSSHEISSQDIVVKIKSNLPLIKEHFPSRQCTIEHGQELKLFVSVSDHVHPTYTWFHEGKPLQCCGNVLLINKAQKSDSGAYECRVKNTSGEDFRIFKVRVKEERPPPSEKIALIISISKYVNMEPLISPHDDADMLCDCLSEANFKCTVLGQRDRGLTAEELKNGIKKFLRTVKMGSYVLVYFAGHGLMKDNAAYLVASDRSNVCEKIFDEVQNYKPLFFVCILDMCLKYCPNHGVTKQEESMAPYQGDIMKCYTTSDNRSAYEGQQSVYVKNLITVIQESPDLTFEDMIDDVTQRVKRATNGSQVPKRIIIGSGDFRLFDPVRN